MIIIKFNDQARLFIACINARLEMDEVKNKMEDLIVIDNELDTEVENLYDLGLSKDRWNLSVLRSKPADEYFMLKESEGHVTIDFSNDMRDYMSIYFMCLLEESIKDDDNVKDLKFIFSSSKDSIYNFATNISFPSFHEEGDINILRFKDYITSTSCYKMSDDYTVFDSYDVEISSTTNNVNFSIMGMMYDNKFYGITMEAPIEFLYSIGLYYYWRTLSDFSESHLLVL